MADVIDRIEEIRTRNNGAWMSLLRIALESDPERTREVLARIDEHDREISKLLRRLADDT
jgi:hypothetical protein